MRWKPFIILILFLIFLLSLGVSSCSTKRGVLIKSLPRDNSWFTRARWIALTNGKEYYPGFWYHWSSKTIYISGERTYYEISYFNGEKVKSVTLRKKHGSLVRAITYFEDDDRYYVKDLDFHETIEGRYITKEEAEGLAYNFFKELDRYGLE